MINTETGKEELIIPIAKAKKSTRFYHLSHFLIVGALSLAYLLLSAYLVGHKSDQVVLVLLFSALYFLNRNTRRLALGFSIFIIYWIIFDYMKAFPNYLYNEVQIASLYNLEKALFGIEYNGARITPNEYFSINHNSFTDILSGIFYFCWVPVPLAFAAVMFFKNRKLFFYFALTFFLSNLIGFIGYYAIPAAPPWYVAEYGFDFNPATPGHTAGLARFDEMFGISLFAGIYAKSSNVFAAMPSMHAAFMLIVLYYGIRFRLGAVNWLFALVMLGIWFTAIYSGHHYILDVLAGIVTAILAIAGLRLFVERTATGRRFLQYLLYITR